MARTKVQNGKILSFLESVLLHPTHTDGLVDAGDPVLVGRIAGVAEISATATTDLISVDTEGVHDLSVTAIGNGISLGETLYIDPSTGVISNDLSDTPFGAAMEALASGTDTINVLLFGATPGATGYFS